MKRILLAGWLAVGLAGAALAQSGQYPNNTVAGNVSGAVAPATPMTTTQLTTLCNTVTASLSGCVPSFPNTITTFFRGDGTYNVPPTVTSGAPGYVPAFPNTVTTFFRGDGTYNVPPTVTGGAPGYAPAFPNNTTTFFRGDGTYAVPLTSAALDAAFGSTRGSILERGAAGWQILTPCATSGFPLVFNGIGADPGCQALTAAGIASATITGTQVAAGTIANSNLANMAANTIKANPTGGAAAPIDWAIAASNSVEGTGVNGLDGQQFFIWHAPITPSTPQGMTLRVDRDPSYTGGSPSSVYNAIWGRSVVSSGVADNEWAILGEVDNSSTSGGQNVGGYFQGNKMVSNASPTWGGVLQIIEKVSTTNPTTPSVGAEIDLQANNTDTGLNRVLLELVGQKGVGATLPTISYGIRLGPTNGNNTLAQFGTGLYFNNATFNVGIDLTAAGNSFTTAAIKTPGFAVDGSGNLTANNLTTAWTAFTPTPTCGTATITTNSARFRTTGKTTNAQVEFTFTAIGTCTNNLTINLPNTSNSSGALAGGDTNTNNTTICRMGASATQASCIMNAGAAYGGTSHIIVSGVYENQ
jgi:hypothetical protein